ncbi:hypothetical protein Bpfe_022658 [Biomphalaria pfeifferi]|uniref:Uncharacterized protein n=1 Tax=Biomphalaria pfeifferi TaxID=112525 RepID=A0AAD8B5M3_BIOPF|nr:hypothetical protein Bpfe_022658 [Biomphalaria pfeifferi]
MMCIVWFLMEGISLSYLVYVTAANEILMMQPYQKAASVSGLHWGLVAEVDYVVIYAHINILKLDRDTNGLKVGFNVSSMQQGSMLLCVMTIRPEAYCFRDERRLSGNVCYCDNKKKESITFVLNVTTNREMNGSHFVFWLDEGENVSLQLPEHIYVSMLVPIIDDIVLPVEDCDTQKEREVKIALDDSYLKLLGIFQILVFVFFTVAAIVLIVILIFVTGKAKKSKRPSNASNSKIERYSVATGPSAAESMVDKPDGREKNQMSHLFRRSKSDLSFF